MLKEYINSAIRYRFLLSQLVSRDFKTRYKRSVLGVLWSMLNPLLTMCVQYIVFSNLFRFEVENYAVYLLIGTVTFNFFSEATQGALSSVTGGASLLTKVHIPTYVFPVSKVLSACINWFFSTIALYLILLIQGLSLNVYHLLLPFAYVCLVLFACGIGMVLSALMVYFRDIQFLYNVLIVLWMYLTPCFYPISIIPESWLGVYRMNPMFHYIDFIRTIILYGKIPEMEQFMYCIGHAIAAMTIGFVVFRKLKRNFVLHI